MPAACRLLTAVLLLAALSADASEDAAGPDAELRARLSRQFDAADAARRRLREQRMRASGYSSTSAQCKSAPPANESGAVAKELADIRQAALATAAAPEQAALRAYLEQRLPTPGEVPRQQSECFPEFVIVSDNDVSSLFARVSSTFKSLFGRPSLLVSLTITSAPAGASFEIGPASGGSPRQAGTPTRLTNLYRGLYRYRVARPGYHDILSTLNLVDEDISALSCQLLLISEPGPAPPCGTR